MLDTLFELKNTVWGDTVIWFLGLWALLTFIRKVSKDADAELDPVKKKLLGEALEGMHGKNISSWVPDFTFVFDQFFSKKHLSWRCFYRSVLISMTVLSCLILLSDIFRIDTLSIEDFFVIILLASVCNPLIDYLSLLETRVILSFSIPTYLKIIIDAFLTFILTFIWLSLLIFIFYSEVQVPKNLIATVTYTWDHIIGTGGNRDTAVLARMSLFTSYTTSIWLWLHGIAQVSIRGLSSITMLMSWLNVQEAPLRAIGTTINVIFLTFGILMFPFFIIIMRP